MLFLVESLDTVTGLLVPTELRLVLLAVEMRLGLPVFGR